MGFKGIWRMMLALLVTGMMFWFITIGFLYVIVIIPAIFVMVLSRRRIFIIIAFLTVFLTVLVGVMAILGYSDEMAAGAAFFVRVYSLIIPDGIGSNWSQSLPLLFETVISVSMFIFLIFIGFAYFWKRKEYDKWLVEAFSFTLLTLLFIYTLVCIFAVTINAYDFMRTNFVSLFIWEILFVWLPFYALVFMIYFLLGYLFRRI